MQRPFLEVTIRNPSASALICVALSVCAPAFAASEFETLAPHAVIIDYETGTVLFEKDAREAVPPASMTKIMTADMVFEALETGTLTEDTVFRVSENAWRRGGSASGSSTMFLDLNSEVSVGDLLKGVIIQSGNDACIVLAEGMAGSELAFADRMNARGRELGLASINFVNSTGWPDEGHVISTLDLARLAEHTIRTYPERYRLYAEPRFEWNGIAQANRNPLLGRMDGADGLKTGHTEVSGYGLVASAERGGERRIVVVNGLDSEADRARESERLMRAAFDQFRVYDLLASGAAVGEIEVYMGEADTVGVAVAEDVSSGLFRGDRDGLRTRIEYTAAPAPVTKGDTLATLIVSEPGRDERRIELVATEDVARKGAMGRALDSLVAKIRS